MDKKVTDKHLAEIAKFLPKWKVVAKLLGLEGEMVRDIEDRYRDGEDQRLEALMKWVGKDGPQATYGKIYDVLRDIEEGEAAEKVEELTEKVEELTEKVEELTRGSIGLHGKWNTGPAQLSTLHIISSVLAFLS
eukprot:Em0003g183a